MSVSAKNEQRKNLNAVQGAVADATIAYIQSEAGAENVQIPNPTEQPSKPSRLDDGTSAYERARRLVTNLSSNGLLSTAGREYLAAINEHALTAVTGANVRIWSLNEPCVTTVIEYGRKIMLIMMAESIGSNLNDNLTPAVAMAIPAVDSWKTLFQAECLEKKIPIDTNLSIAMTMVVTPADYGKLDTMKDRIAAIILAETHREMREMTLVDMIGRYNLRASVSMEEVNDYLDRHFPLAAKPRADYGFVLYTNDKNRRQQQAQQAHYADAYNRGDEFFGLVTGFTELLPSQSGNTGIVGLGATTQQRIQPVIHLSFMGGIFPTTGTIEVLVPIAREIFLVNGLWAAPYRNVGKNRPNIGNLWPDPNNNGAPFVCDNQAQVSNILNQMFETPIIVIDVAEGSYHIPELSAFASPEQEGIIVDEFARFLAQSGVDSMPVGNFATPFYHEYIGTIPARNGELRDSRWYDYLSTMTLMPNEYARARFMLHRSADPKIRASQLRELYSSELRLLYDNTVAAVNSTTIELLMRAFQSKTQFTISGLSGAIQQQQQLDLSAVLAATSQSTLLGGIAPGSSASAINPISSTIYQPIVRPV